MAFGTTKIKTVEGSTVVVDPARSLPPAVRSRRKSTRWRVVVSALILALGLVVAATANAVRYQPLRQGSGGFGPRTLAVIKELTDGVQPTRYILDTPTGGTGTLVYPVTNTGRWPVRLLGLDTASTGDGERLAWSPEFAKDGEVGGARSEVQAFPMTLRAHQTISLWLTVSRPTCAPDGSEGIVEIPLRFSAFGINHTYALQLDGSAGYLPVELCWPRTALNHVQ
jgi:hypothetical protein